MNQVLQYGPVLSLEQVSEPGPRLQAGPGIMSPHVVDDKTRQQQGHVQNCCNQIRDGDRNWNGGEDGVELDQTLLRTFLEGAPSQISGKRALKWLKHHKWQILQQQCLPLTVFKPLQST